MPAPLGNTPTKKMPNIQVFGLDDSNATRAALRFFRERRIVVHYVDLRKKPIASGELRHPEAFAKIVDVLVENSVQYLVSQLKAGADALQIFDTWAGVLPPREFLRWSM